MPKIFWGRLTGGLRLARQIARFEPGIKVDILALPQSHFTKRLLDQGKNILVIPEKKSALSIFGDLYGSARFGRDPNLLVAADFESKFIEKKLNYVIDALPPAFINQIMSFRLETKDCENPSLTDKIKGRTSITVYEACQELNITSHILHIFISLYFIQNAHALHNNGNLVPFLKTRGNPQICGAEGLAPAAQDILKLQQLGNPVWENPQMYQAFIAAMLIHDIGKFINQADHGRLTRKMLQDHGRIKKCIKKYFTKSQIALIETICEGHSYYSDTAFLKEKNLSTILSLLEKIKDPVLQRIADNALLIASVIDTDAFGRGRLSPDRIKDVLKTHALLQDIKKNGVTRELKIAWGKARFESWTGREEDPPGETRANKEYLLKDLIDQIGEANLPDFFEKLGSFEQVGLIFDLKREIESPKARSNLVIWLVKLSEEFKTLNYEFCINRRDRQVLMGQVDLLTKILERRDYKALFNALQFKHTEQNDYLEIFFPPSGNFEYDMHLKGFSEFLDLFPPQTFNKIFDVTLNPKQKYVEDLSELVEENRGVTLNEALKSIGQFDHIEKILKHYRDVFKNSIDEHKATVLFSELRKRGDRLLTGEEGLSTVTTRYIQLGRIYSQIEATHDYLKILIMGSVLHDIGKVIGQMDHPFNSYKIITENQEIRDILELLFKPHQLRLLETFIRNHSILSDLAVIKEKSLANLFALFYEECQNQNERNILPKILVLFSIADMDAVGERGRLSEKRIHDLISLFKAVEELPGENSIDDLIDDRVLRGWGKTRWNSWVLTEQADRKTQSLEARQAFTELQRFYPTEEDYKLFFRLLGSPELIALIFDTCKSLDDSVMRARLLIWLVHIISKYKYKKYNFSINRADLDRFAKEIKNLTLLLQDFSINKLDQELILKPSTDRSIIEIIIPTK